MWLAEGSFFSQGGSDGGQEARRSSHPRQVSAILLATQCMASPLRPQALLHSPRLRSVPVPALWAQLAASAPGLRSRSAQGRRE